MRKWISFGLALLWAASLPLSASTRQTAFPLGTTEAPYGYYEYLPGGYGSDPDQEWPVVVFLHGLGVRGDGSAGQLPRVLTEALPKNIEDGAQYSFLVISPQSPELIPGQFQQQLWWDVGVLDAMIEYVKLHYPVDLDRIYLTGASMGGGGVWNYAKAHPEKLAAILPVCGAASTPEGAKLVKVPTWAFHAWGDSTVSAKESVDWINAIAGALAGAPSNAMANYPGTYSALPSPGATSDRDRTASYSFNAVTGTGSWTWQDDVPQLAGSPTHPNLTLFSNASHDSWTRAYGNPRVFAWLQAQDRNLFNDADLELIAPEEAGTANGSAFFPMQGAFDAQPELRLAGEPVGGGPGGEAPSFGGRVGYIDFGPEWAKVRIHSTWTRYRTWSFGDQTAYAELWWDDDFDFVNDSGLNETGVNFNSARGLDTRTTEPWVLDSAPAAPVAPRARYLLLRSPSTMADRAKEYAIVGTVEDDEDPLPPSLELIEPEGAGAANDVPYFPMQDAFDAPPTLSTAGEPAGGDSNGSDAPYLPNRVGYIDFGLEWYKVRITSTWTRYRNWSIENQTPYVEVWWDDDTDSLNDDGFSETRVNFNTAQNLATGLTEPWLQDRDMGLTPAVPRARYLLLRSDPDMTNRAKEYAIVGYVDPNATP